MSSSRFRMRDATTKTNVFHRCTTSTGLPVSPPYNAEAIWASNVGSVGEYKEITDESFGNYHQRKRSGQILMGNLSLTKRTRSMSPGSISGYNSTWKETWKYYGDLAVGMEQAVGRPTYDVARDITILSQMALAECYARAKQSSIMSGEVLSDLGKTVGMLKHPFRRSTNLLQKMHQYKLKHLKKSGSNLTEACSNAWLEYRYGWQPIILDADTLFQEAHRIRASCSRSLVARSTKSTSAVQVKSVVDARGSEFAPFWTYFYTATGNFKIEVRASAGVMYEVKPRTTSENMQQILGSRPQDTVQLIWEKIPFSFVVDWFANVGTWLQAVTPDPFLTVRGSWATTVTREDISYSGSCKRQIGTPWATGTAGSSSITSEKVVRDANPSLTSHPVLTVEPLSRLHQADAMALMLTPIRGLLKGLRH